MKSIYLILLFSIIFLVLVVIIITMSSKVLGKSDNSNNNKSNSTTSSTIYNPCGISNINPNFYPLDFTPDPDNGPLKDWWFTQDMFDTIFPYAAASAVFTQDGTPYWSYNNLKYAITWLENHPDKSLHGFATSSSDDNVNKSELLAFLAQSVIEVGFAYLGAPFNGGYTQSGMGGFLGITEAFPEAATGTSKNATAGLNQVEVTLSDTAQKILFPDDITQKTIFSWTTRTAGTQVGHNLGASPAFTEVFPPTTAAVSDNGTMYGNASPTATDACKVMPLSDLTGKSISDRRYGANNPYSSYHGRGSIQLSNYDNYSYCSLELFNDYRLILYPNLIVTTDFVNFHGNPRVFGFPGSNPSGANPAPKSIVSTTPPAPILGWLAGIYFWMKPMSGYPISCHDCMIDSKLGITIANSIVNAQTGCGGNFSITDLPGIQPPDPKPYPQYSQSAGISKVFDYLTFCKLCNVVPQPLVCPPPTNCRPGTEPTDKLCTNI